jgi:hypothetical protein
VGLVLGQHHRAVGQLAQLLVQGGQDLVAVGIALGDQAGPPPAGDLTHAPGQGPQGDSGAATLPPQPGDGSGPGLVQQPQDAPGQAGLPLRGLPKRGRSARPATPWRW